MDSPANSVTTAVTKKIMRFFVLDRSGSMDTIADDTIGGYNSFVRDQKEFGGTMSLIQFDDLINTVYENVEIENVQPLTKDTYIPRGSTALYDAIGYAIKMVEEQTEIHKDAEFTIVILTDGFDNASRNYNSMHIKDLVRIYTRLGWDFMFLGASSESILAAQNIGMDETQTMQFNPREVASAFRCLSSTMSQQAQGRVATLCDTARMA